MYQFSIPNKVGDYVVSIRGIVYKINAITIHIAKDEELFAGRESIVVLFEGVTSNGKFHLMNALLVGPAREVDIEKFLREEKSLLEVKTVHSSLPRSIDEVLDEYLTLNNEDELDKKESLKAEFEELAQENFEMR